MARPMRISTRPNLNASIFRFAHRWAIFQAQNHQVLNPSGLKARKPARLHTNKPTRPQVYMYTHRLACMRAIALAAGGKIRKRRPGSPG